MNKEVKRLPDLELEVMLVIWRGGRRMHTGEIAQVLSSGKARPIQVIQTVLGRLCDKDFVRCEKIGRLNYYEALVAEHDYRERETATFLEKMYGNSPAKLVAALVESQSLTEDDLGEIRKILERGGGSGCR